VASDGQRAMSLLLKGVEACMRESIKTVISDW